MRPTPPASVPPGADPNAVYAEWTGYRDFVRPAAAAPEAYPVLFELKGRDHAGSLRRLAKDRGWKIPQIYPDTAESLPKASAFATAVLDRSQYEALYRGDLGAIVKRWELQLPVIPGRPAGTGRPPAAPGRGSWVGAERDNQSPVPAGKSMFGVIDNVCPFARADLQGSRGPRVVRLWDQDANPAFAVIGGSAPAAFGYGAEVDRSMLARGMDRHRDSARAVDEAASYREAQYTAAAPEFGHGAAVLGLLAGPVPLPARESADPDAVPRWQRAEDAASAADIVFVQMPRDSVQDSTSASLGRCLLDGLRYIVACAGPEIEQIVINISDGTSRTAHDGHSMIERAMVDLVADLAQRQPPLRLELAVAAGNGFAEMRHARFALDRPRQGALLRLPPGCEMPTFVTLSVPRDLRGLEIGVAPPGYSGMAKPWTAQGQIRFWPSEDDPACCIVFPPPAARHGVALIVWAPTAALDRQRTTAPAGDWRIEVRAQALEAKRPLAVHAWVSRNQQNPGALSRGRQAHFVDADGLYDPGRVLRPAEDDAADSGSGRASTMRRRGSLNGIATMSRHLGIVVVGGRMLRQDRPSLYSSEGPAPGRDTAPDSYYAADASRTLAGIRVAGNASGRTVRAEGTSFAAPQAARALLNGEDPPPPPRRRRR